MNAYHVYRGGCTESYVFPNGLEVTVSRNTVTKGGNAGLFEIAVWKDDGELYCDTIGWLTHREVADYLDIVEIL